MLKIPGEKIKIPQKKTGFGSFSSYFKISPKRGIKVIEFCDREREVFAYSEEQLLNSFGWQSALSEFNTLKKVESTKLAPKAFKIVPVFDSDNDRWYPGIIMEHVDGKCFEKSRRKKCLVGKTEVICEKNELDIFLPENLSKLINNKLSACGVIHNDLHDRNVIVKKGMIKVLDFGQCTEIK